MRKLFFLFSFFYLTNLSAWWDGGHMAIAQIAYDNLREDVKKKVDALCESFHPFSPELSTFVTASIWADEIKERNCFPLFDKLHFIEIPYDPDNILTKNDRKILAASNAENNVVYLIEKAIATLQNRQAKEFEKALMLRLLIHCVADIHQPMHCCSLYNKKFRNGDLGGNRYTLKGKYANLHLLWDSGAGAFSENRYMEKPFDSKKKAQELMALYPKKELKKVSSPEKWAKESHNLAIKEVYQIPAGSTPNEEYLEKVCEVAKRQAALAGYRLAEILNSIDLSF